METKYKELEQKYQSLGKFLFLFFNVFRTTNDNFETE